MRHTDHRASFRSNGYVVLKDYFSSETSERIKLNSFFMGEQAKDILYFSEINNMDLEEFCRKFDKNLIVVPEKDRPEQVCRFEYILGSNSEMRDIFNAQISPLISSFMGEPYVAFKDKENEKHSGGGAFPPHQDFAAYQIFGPRFNVTAMLSVDSATLENGCLYFAKGYKDIIEKYPNAIRENVQGNVLFNYSVGGVDNGNIVERLHSSFDWEAVETNPRDLVIFDSFVPHYSKKNESEASRRAMFITTNALREGEWYNAYYNLKRNDPKNIAFHVSTPTVHKSSEDEGHPW